MSHGLHARAPTGQIKYDVTNAKQFHLDACRVAQNISESPKHIVSSGHQITQALILSLSVHCACFKPHTETSKAELLPCQKKNYFLIHLTHPYHIVVPQIRGMQITVTCICNILRHIISQCRHSDQEQVHVYTYVHKMVSGSDLHCSPSCSLASYKSLQEYTYTIEKIHAPFELPLYLSDTDNLPKFQLHRNNVLCVSNFANFILIIQTSTGILTF